MLNVASAYVQSSAVAEEVVQEAWLGVLMGIERFEGRSSLKTWVMRILTNCAQRRRDQERRTIPFSDLHPSDGDSDTAVDPARFRAGNDPWPGHWRLAPHSWSGIPEAQLLSRELRQHLRSVIDGLPRQQRQVIVLRDVAGLSSAEVCDALAITEVNQRVLLHRARSRVRATIERYLRQ
jgi:RNA polymerase sigma-70 factor (ECF subfamily)